MAKIFDKTKNDETANTGNVPDFNKTQVFQTWSDTEIQAGPNPEQNAPRDFSKTFIQEETEDSTGGHIVTERATRKITGWLVSFSIDPMGVDFRIYEGINTVGRDHDNSIVIPNDMAVSGKHLTILAKKDKVYIKDEMAANGTFLNGDEMEVGKPYELNDGDQIKLGDTLVKFRCC